MVAAHSTRKGFAATCSAATWSFGLLVLAAVSSVEAADVPGSAYSASLAMPASLLDRVNLVYVFPHRLGYFDSQLFALDPSTINPFLSIAAIGVTGHSQRTGFLALTAPAVNPDFDPRRSTQFQAGWALRAGNVHAGLAARGSRAREESSSWFADDRVPFYSVQESRKYEQQAEAAASVGVDAGRVEFDAALEGVTDRLEAEWSRISSEDTLSVAFESEKELRVGLTARLAFVPWDSTEIVAFGHWREPRGEVRGTVRQGAGPQRSVALAGGATEWSAGFLMSFETSLVEWVGVSGYWRSEPEEVELQFDGQASRNRLEWGALALGARHRIWRDWILRAGVSVRLERTFRASVYNAEYVQSSLGETERLVQEFSWGTGFRWRSLVLDATLQRRLDLSQLLALLDVHILL